MNWYNEPKQWREQNGQITVTADPDTDAWRVTLHGYTLDSAHFYYQDVRGDFTATVSVAGQYTALYDQAGLMVRESERVWMKCGIEYVDGVRNASAVITRDFSDWSILPLADAPESVWFQVRRIGAAVEVYFSRDGADFMLIRQGYLSKAESLQVGLMCAAPRGQGFKTVFESFTVVN